MNTNLRSIKRDHRGTTALKKSQQDATDVCEFCCMNKNCPYQDHLNEARYEFGLVVGLNYCRHYVMPIVFRDLTGLSGQFNTMRMGPAFSRRLEPGDTVGLVNKNNEIHAYAKVKEVLLLDKEHALMSHAKFNHMLIEEDLTSDEASEKLAKILRNNYGNLVYTSNEKITVIYLEEQADQ